MSDYLLWQRMRINNLLYNAQVCVRVWHGSWREEWDVEDRRVMWPIGQGHPRSPETTWFDEEHASCCECNCGSLLNLLKGTLCWKSWFLCTMYLSSVVVAYDSVRHRLLATKLYRTVRRWKNLGDMFCHFATILERDRQTEGRTSSDSAAAVHAR